METSNRVYRKRKGEIKKAISNIGDRGRSMPKIKRFALDAELLIDLRTNALMVRRMIHTQRKWGRNRKRRRGVCAIRVSERNGTEKTEVSDDRLNYA